MHADSPTHHVMAGFSDAYRAWLESVSAKPQTLLDLQGKYMQEQMNLWMQAFQPEAGKEAAAARRQALQRAGVERAARSSATTATPTSSPRR